MAQPPAPPSRAPFYVTVVFFAIAVTLVLVAMRGAPPPTVVIERPGTPAEPREVAVIMRDYLFDPTPLHLVPGETVRFLIFNAGLERHELVLGDEAVQNAWASADAAATPPMALATAPVASAPAGTGGLRVLLGSGAQTAVEWPVPDGGALLLMCHLPGHVEQGMVGRVVWLEAQDTAPSFHGTPR